MAVKLYQPAFDQAKRLIKTGRFVHDDRDAWSEHQPEKVHRCGLLAAESRAGQRRYSDIELAVAHLHGMLDALG